jgi:hypothetical protein
MSRSCVCLTPSRRGLGLSRQQSRHGGVARAAVTDLSQQRRGAGHRVRAAKERPKDLSVRMRIQSLGDLRVKPGDLAADRLKRGHEREHDLPTRRGLDLAGVTRRRLAQPFQQLAGGSALNRAQGPGSGERRSAPAHTARTDRTDLTSRPLRETDPGAALTSSGCNSNTPASSSRSTSRLSGPSIATT